MRSGVVVSGCDLRGRLRIRLPVRGCDDPCLLGPGDRLWAVGASSGLVVLAGSPDGAASPRPARVECSHDRLALGLRLSRRLAPPGPVLTLVDASRGLVYCLTVAEATTRLGPPLYEQVKEEYWWPT